MSRDGREVSSLTASAKRLGVLAFLALRRPRGSHRRDSLVSLFWPESDDQRARGSLRTLLSTLRRELGSDALTTHGDEVALSPSHVWCDAAAFEDALDGGDLERALELYAGPLLSGFHPGGAQELDQWVDDRRAEMARRATDAAWELCRLAEADGDDDGAIVWARRAMALSPHDERGVRRLMVLLEAAGDRAGAIREYEAFARRLTLEYDLEPSADTTALVDSMQADATEGAAGTKPARRGSPAAPLSTGAQPPEAVEGTLDTRPSGHAAVDGKLPRPRRGSPLRRIGLILGVVAAGVVAVLLLGRPSRASVSLNASRVAVFPFSVSGASPSLAYLRQGMVDLLASDLGGRSGPHAVDPGVAVAAWQAAMRASGDSTLSTQGALPVAAGLGAGLTVLGEVVGTPSHVVLNVTLVDVHTGGTVTRARVAGATDSLAVLTDRLAGKLLAGTAGESGLSDDVFAETPLPALRDYLEGLQAYRRGRFSEATSLLGSSLDRDSTFAEAALALAMAGSWAVDPAPLIRGLRLGWQARGRLSAGDRALLAAIGPAPGTTRSTADHLEAWEKAVEANPDRAEAWYGLGDVLLHWGAMVGRLDARERAYAALDRSASLRPGFAAPYDHLVELNIGRGDTAAAAARLKTFLVTDSGAPIADYLRWRLALADHDTRTLVSIRERMDSVPTASLIRIVGMGVLDGVGLQDVPRAGLALASRPGAPTDRAGWLYLLAMAALDRGRPSEAQAYLSRYAELETLPHDAMRVTVLSGLYSDGDTTAARAAFATLAAGLRQGGPAGASEPGGVPGTARAAQGGGAAAGLATMEARARDVCVTAQWRAWHGGLAAADRAVVVLQNGARAERVADPDVARLEGECAVMVRAITGVLGGRTDARVALAAADSVQDEGDFMQTREYTADVALARLHELEGDFEGALSAVRRRPYHYWFSLGALATAVRIEGDLDERLGKRAAAEEADRRYLGLRGTAESALLPRIEEVRRRLGTLEAAGTTAPAR